MRALRPFALLALLGCGCTDVSEMMMLDRSDLDLLACTGTLMSPLAGITPADAVDYLEQRSDWGSEGAVGERCAGASERPACEAAFGALTAPTDGWQTRTGGGAPAPLTYFAYTRGDEVGVVGRADLVSFLAPTDDVFDAAFLAQIETLGVVDCTAPAARAVPGGHEVVTRRTATCGGAVDDFRVFVGTDGTAMILESVNASPGEEMICP
jgi:hypothetical protein